MFPYYVPRVPFRTARVLIPTRQYRPAVVLEEPMPVIREISALIHEDFGLRISLKRMDDKPYVLVNGDETMYFSVEDVMSSHPEFAMHRMENMDLTVPNAIRLFFGSFNDIKEDLGTDHPNFDRIVCTYMRDRYEEIRDDVQARIIEVLDIMLDFDLIQRVSTDKEFSAFEKITTMQAQSDKCVICLEDYSRGAELIRLPCAHDFHATCVKKWLCEHHNCCPLCRESASEGVLNH